MESIDASKGLGKSKRRPWGLKLKTIFSFRKKKIVKVSTREPLRLVTNVQSCPSLKSNFANGETSSPDEGKQYELYVTVQSWLRMRRNRRSYLKKMNFIIKCQVIIRDHLTKERLLQIRQEIRKIVGYNIVLRWRLRKTQQQKTTLTIRLCQRHIVSVLLAKKQKSVLKCQKCIRIFLAKNALWRLRVQYLRRCCCLIQSQWRMLRTRRIYLDVCVRIVKCQAHCRKRLAIKTVGYLQLRKSLETKAATIIRTWWLKKRQRNLYLRVQKKTQAIPTSYSRGLFLRRNYEEYLDHVMELLNKKVVIIQSWVKMLIARKNYTTQKFFHHAIRKRVRKWLWIRRWKRWAKERTNERDSTWSAYLHQKCKEVPQHVRAEWYLLVSLHPANKLKKRKAELLIRFQSLSRGFLLRRKHGIMLKTESQYKLQVQKESREAIKVQSEKSIHILPKGTIEATQSSELDDHLPSDTAKLKNSTSEVITLSYKLSTVLSGLFTILFVAFFLSISKYTEENKLPYWN